MFTELIGFQVVPCIQYTWLSFATPDGQEKTISFLNVSRAICPQSKYCDQRRNGPSLFFIFYPGEVVKGET